MNVKRIVAKHLLLIAKKMLNRHDHNEFMFYGYQKVNNVFRITLLIEMKCFMGDEGYYAIKDAIKETKSLFSKIERIANKLQCRKVGYNQKGTMSVGIFDAESEDIASDFIDRVLEIKPKFIVNKMK